MGKIAKRDPRDIQLTGFTLTAVGVEVTGKPTIEEWRAAMQFIDRAASASMWWHGDMLNFGYASYGELASQEDGDGKYAQKSLYQAKWVASQVPFSIRLENLSFGHHETVASLPEGEQKRWLETASEENMSVSALRRATADARVVQELEEHPVPKGKYTLVYADPPWRYDFSISDSRKIENHYPTMEVGAICELPIADLAAENCVLFLWGTSPKLIEAFSVIESWGFEYKTCMVWRKDKIGMGYYARQCHELLLIATRGAPDMPPEKSRPESVIDAPRGEHSRKPDVFYEIIEAMYPKSKRIELFCRRARKGWKAWGNERQPMHDFQNSLAKSHAAEDLPLWREVYQKAFVGFIAMHNHRQDGEHQRAGIDRSIILANSKQILIDEKVRFKNEKTGRVYDDILVEYLSDVQRNQPGWACKPLRCDYIAYAIAPLGKCYLLPVPALQAAWQSHGSKWIKDYPICDAQNPGWTTRSVPVPIDVIFPAIGQALRIEFTPTDGTVETYATPGVDPPSGVTREEHAEQQKAKQNSFIW